MNDSILADAAATTVDDTRTTVDGLPWHPPQPTHPQPPFWPKEWERLGLTTGYS